MGKVSLDDWLALTWSLGCTSTPARPASEAITSLAFMLELVPEPVWKTSIGKASSWSPAATSRAAALDRLGRAASRTPSSPLTRAAAALTSPIAWMRAGSIGVPLIGKFSTARWVWARHSAVAGHLDLAHRVVLGPVAASSLTTRTYPSKPRCRSGLRP